jgi:dTDP-4-dehydrorhamnose 3,5-epimerase
MRSESTPLEGVTIIEPARFPDARGVFFESWERDRYAAAGLPVEWRQDNIVHSTRGILRGMHFQHPRGQHKLVTAIVGEIFDVAIDIRRGSPTFGRWFGATLSAENGRQLSIGPGFAHGYLVTSETSIVAYKCSERYDATVEHSVRWDDPEIAIAWPGTPTVISPKDAAARMLRELSPNDLPE